MMIFAQILCVLAGVSVMFAWFAHEERCFATRRLFVGCTGLFASGVLVLNLMSGAV